MIKDNDLISVRNRNSGTTGYNIPEQNIYRKWEVGQTKKVPFGELKAFSFMPGGIYALTNLLIVEDKEALELLINENVEPEYYYTEEDIKKILFQGNYDEFADFLDFAPEGALAIAKDIAIKEEIPDVNKRNMLSEKTGLNINNAIMVNHVMADEDEIAEVEAPKQRRVPVKEETPAPARRAETPKYNVVKK